MSGYDYWMPNTLDEAFDLKERHPEARFVAGGTDLLVQMKNRLSAPTALISLRSVAGLGAVDVGEVTRVGAACTIADLLEHPDLGTSYPILAQAASRLGSPQIRSVATVGGNLANGSPCADTALALLALEARTVIRSRDARRELPLADFFVGPKQTCLRPDEILTEIILDPPASGARAVFFKKGRVRMDIATASLGVVASLEGSRCTKARVAVGSVAPVPTRLPRVEQVLEGAELSRTVIEQARDAAERSIAPITDVRATAEYRRRLIGVYMQRALARLSGEGIR